jgi:hypothetical protein
MDPEGRETYPSASVDTATTTDNDTEFVSNYKLQLAFPAIVLAAAAATTTDDDTNTATTHNTTQQQLRPLLRTNNELVQLRLLEAGVEFESPVTLGETAERLHHFCQDLEKTGCFHRVAVEIGDATTDQITTKNNNGTNPPAGAPQNNLKVILEEKDWYRLHLGGGVKAQDLLNGAEIVESSSHNGPLPIAAEFEASAGLRNLSGCLDQSSLAYRLDTHGMTSWTLSHERPFYTFLPSIWRDVVLTSVNGSQYSLSAKASLDTLDYEYSRSYREYHRHLMVQLCNQHSLPDSPMAKAMIPNWFTSLSWSLLLRDIVPRQQVASPWLSAASPSILQQAGPSLKHSISALVRTNGAFVQNGEPLNPTDGWQAYAEGELALPPGDVHFGKIQAGAALHVPVNSMLSLHWIGQTGWLRHMTWATPTTEVGRKSSQPTVSDRFHMGGPLQLPGFLPAGIGPRDTRTGTDSLTPGGDSMGGDLYYRTTLQASVPALRFLVPDGRAFGFVSAGTCVQQGSLSSLANPVTAFLGSTRASMGVGFATTALAGSRLEMTYAWPLRFSPVDVRRNFQVGIGVSIG